MKNPFLFVLTFIVLLLPVLAFAQSDDGAVKYAPLITIDGLTNSVQGESFSQYVNFLYGFSIAIAALLAVIKIIIAGVKYMLSSLPGTKGDAKTEIQGALLGLLLILGAFLILNTINPALTNTAIQFDEIEKQADIQNRPDGVRPTGDTSSLIAENQAVSDRVSGGCGTRTPFADDNNTYVTLDFSGCPTQIGNNIIAFNADCRSRNGFVSLTPDNLKSTCRTPKATTAIVESRFGQPTQARVTNTTTNTPEQLVTARNACEDRLFATARVINGPTGTFVGATVRCTQPAYITYTDQPGRTAETDCRERTRPGKFIADDKVLQSLRGKTEYCVF